MNVQIFYVQLIIRLDVHHFFSRSLRPFQLVTVQYRSNCAICITQLLNNIHLQNMNEIIFHFSCGWGHECSKISIFVIRVSFHHVFVLKHRSYHKAHSMNPETQQLCHFCTVTRQHRKSAMYMYGSSSYGSPPVVYHAHFLSVHLIALIQSPLQPGTKQEGGGANSIIVSWGVLSSILFSLCCFFTVFISIHINITVAWAEPLKG